MADGVVTAVQDVLDQAGGAAIDHANVEVNPALEIVTAQMGDTETARPLVGFDGLLKLLDCS